MSDWLSAAYEKYYEKMVGVAYRGTGSRTVAEDLTQDVFVLAIAREKELATHPNIEAWFMLTLRNLIHNELRHMRLGDIPLDDVAHLLREGATDEFESLLPHGLSPRERELLLWRYRDQTDFRTIANRLGISETACRSRVVRVLSKCKKTLTNTMMWEKGGTEREAGTAGR